MTGRTPWALPIIALCSGCLNRPSFVPVPAHVYSGFVALREPRSDLPIGALWVDGYGPTGDAAAADNLVTTKSLSGVTFDNGFQASLTLGLLKFLDLDPSYSSKMTAHFGDLSIVRIKDFSKLSGPAEQPRIYEALKASSITITAIGNVGLDIENRAVSQHLPVFGRGTSAIAKSFTIDGRDMFIAFEIASQQKVASPVATARVGTDRATKLRIGTVDLTLRLPAQDVKHCSNGAIALQQPGSSRLEKIKVSADGAAASTLLRVPVSDGRGGLYTSIEVKTAPRNTPAACGILVSANLAGVRLSRRSPRQPDEL